MDGRCAHLFAHSLQARDQRRARVLGAIARYRTAKAGKDPEFLMHFSTFMNSWTDWLAPDAGQVVKPKPPRLEDDPEMRALAEIERRIRDGEGPPAPEGVC